MKKGWPILYKDILRIGNPDSSVGIATLWTERDVVKKLIGDDTSYAVIGNLYSSAGISAMIRNIYAKPTIRNIILWGADLSRSGQTLLEFMQNGIDSDYKIKGDTGGGEIEKQIPKEALSEFRKSVQVINLRGKSPKDLLKTVKKLSDKKSAPFSMPRLFPRPKSSYETFPSEQVCFRVCGETTAQTWLKVLNNIMRYGRAKKTRYAKNNELKELLNLTAVINKEDIKNPYIPHYLPFSEKDLKKYIPQVVSAKEIPSVSYTYGQRLRDHAGTDQIQEIIELIKRRPFSKKMIAATIDVKKDWDRKNVDRGDTPCLTQVLCSIQDNKLIFTGHFRSQDMVHGWPRNVLSLIKLQDMIAKKTGYERGKFCLITHSAHIYTDDFQLVENIISEYYEKELGFTASQHFSNDPRGNIIVSVEGQKRKRGPEGKHPFKENTGKITASLYAPESEGGLLLKKWTGKKAMEVYLQITDWDFLSMPGHLIYIGTELQRAEFAVRFGYRYTQDPGPNKLF